MTKNYLHIKTDTLCKIFKITLMASQHHIATLPDLGINLYTSFGVCSCTGDPYQLKQDLYEVCLNTYVLTFKNKIQNFGFLAMGIPDS